jgi:hypothetical protein
LRGTANSLSRGTDTRRREFNHPKSAPIRRRTRRRRRRRRRRELNQRS